MFIQSFEKTAGIKSKLQRLKKHLGIRPKPVTEARVNRQMKRDGYSKKYLEYQDLKKNYTINGEAEKKSTLKNPFANDRNFRVETLKDQIGKVVNEGKKEDSIKTFLRRDAEKDLNEKYRRIFKRGR